jgi:hypothetical protein
VASRAVPESPIIVKGVNGVSGHVPKRSWGRRQTRLLEARSFIAIKLHAHSEFTLEGIIEFHANHLAGAAPLGGELTGDLFGHLEKDFDHFAFGDARVRGKEDAAPQRLNDSARSSGRPDFQTRTRRCTTPFGLVLPVQAEKRLREAGSDSP